MQSACPFYKFTLEILISNEESKAYIHQFYLLCESINYEFSSPSNSFERKIINILNRKYQLDRCTGDCSIRKKCEPNIEWISIYENLIELLRNDACKIKFRGINDIKFNFIPLTDNDIISNFRSDVLNNEGIIATYNTFINSE
jgi:hypothetical protein